MTSPAEELHPAPVLEPGKTILELRGLEKRYPGTHALKPIDLAFQAPAKSTPSSARMAPASPL